MMLKPTTDPVPEKILQEARSAKEKETRSKLKPQPSTIPARLYYSPTIHSIGIEWEIEGDTKHNATCSVRYRVAGEQRWRDTLPLLRVDYRGWYNYRYRQAYKHFNMLAGSIMFLLEGTEYEIDLELKDPDGGGARKRFTISTRPVPSLRRIKRTFYVVPGGGGGSGSRQDPFRGLETADRVSKAGDLFLLARGDYEGTVLHSAGAPGAYVVWKAEQEGTARIHSTLSISGSYLWIEGLKFEPTRDGFGGIRVARHGVRDLVVVRNTFINCRYALSNPESVWNGDTEVMNTGWYVADNIIQGGKHTEYGTRLFLLQDSELCYNRISDCTSGGDAIAVRFSRNLDIYHNDIYNIDDDLFEPDSAYANIRIWQNRGINPRYQAVSFQPMFCSPWYIVRNEFVLTHPARVATIFKANVYDRTVVVNNTFVVRGRYAQSRADIMMRSFSRNNLWVHIYDNPSERTNPTGAVLCGDGANRKEGRYNMAGQTLPDWRTNADYDGFAWDDLPALAYPFWWGSKRFRTLKEFVRRLNPRGAEGIFEPNALRVPKDTLFTVKNILAYSRERWSKARLTLERGSRAIDAGVPVPNLCDKFNGDRPDLGAHEFASPPAHYGPRMRELEH